MCGSPAIPKYDAKSGRYGKVKGKNSRNTAIVKSYLQILDQVILRPSKLCPELAQPIPPISQSSRISSFGLSLDFRSPKLGDWDVHHVFVVLGLFSLLALIWVSAYGRRDLHGRILRLFNFSLSRTTWLQPHTFDLLAFLPLSCYL